MHLQGMLHTAGTVKSREPKKTRPCYAYSHAGHMLSNNEKTLHDILHKFNQRVGL